jgi:hypothetical protein
MQYNLYRLYIKVTTIDKVEGTLTALICTAAENLYIFENGIMCVLIHSCYLLLIDPDQNPIIVLASMKMGG